MSKGMGFMKLETKADALLGLLILIVSVPFTFLFRGFVVMKIWAWHVVTVFPALGPLSVSQAVSISLAISVLVTQISAQKSGKSFADSLLEGAVTAFIVNLIYLVFGFIIHIFQ